MYPWGTTPTRETARSLAVEPSMDRYGDHGCSSPDTRTSDASHRSMQRRSSTSAMSGGHRGGSSAVRAGTTWAVGSGSAVGDTPGGSVGGRCSGAGCPGAGCPGAGSACPVSPGVPPCSLRPVARVTSSRRLAPEPDAGPSGRSVALGGCPALPAMARAVLAGGGWGPSRPSVACGADTRECLAGPAQAATVRRQDASRSRSVTAVIAGLSRQSA